MRLLSLMTKRIFLPSNSAEDWRALLADPDKHWRAGYSARSAAERWEAANGMPEEVSAVFEHARLGPVELLAAFPEWKTPLPGGRRESRTDVLALVRTARGLFVAGIEAKVAEPFGPTVSEWLADASPGKVERLTFLREKLGLHEDVSALRYQLLHRTASAIIEAERFGAAGAAMIVHSFSQTGAWRGDFMAFLTAMGMNEGNVTDDKPALALAWARGPSSGN